MKGYFDMELENLIIKDEAFKTTMDSEVLPFITATFDEGYLNLDNGLKLHYVFAINPEEKAAVVFSHGYCEFATKYYEIAYYFYKMGYSVFIPEHRGHGFSSRQVEGLSKVHINHFEDYVEDFSSLIENVVKPKSKTKKLILFAHSMGGAIGALYMEEHPDTFTRAILSSPMLEMSTQGTSKAALLYLKLCAQIPGLNTRYVPGHHDYNSEYKYPKCSSISEPRYKYQFDEREREEHYRSNGASYRWTSEAIKVSKKILKNANKVTIPVILCQAGLDILVMPKAQNEFSKLSKNTRLCVFEESKHEIFNATDDIILEYYKTIFDFIS